jgi:hypothetical protein
MEQLALKWDQNLIVPKEKRSPRSIEPGVNGSSRDLNVLGSKLFFERFGL